MSSSQVVERIASISMCLWLRDIRMTALISNDDIVIAFNVLLAGRQNLVVGKNFMVCIVRNDGMLVHEGMQENQLCKQTVISKSE